MYVGPIGKGQFCIGQASRNSFINYFSPLLEPGQQMQLTTLGFRSPGKLCFINCSSSWLCSRSSSSSCSSGWLCFRDEILCSNQFQLQRSIPQDIAVVAGCVLEMKNFATTFLNSARHCISTNTEFYLQRV